MHLIIRFTTMRLLILLPLWLALANGEAGLARSCPTHGAAVTHEPHATVLAFLIALGAVVIAWRRARLSPG